MQLSKRFEEHQKRARRCADSRNEAETDWEESPDWKALSALLQSTAAKWRQHGNVPRRDKKAIEKRFDAATKHFEID